MRGATPTTSHETGGAAPEKGTPPCVLHARGRPHTHGDARRRPTATSAAPSATSRSTRGRPSRGRSRGPELARARPEISLHRSRGSLTPRISHLDRSPPLRALHEREDDRVVAHDARLEPARTQLAEQRERALPLGALGARGHRRVVAEEVRLHARELHLAEAPRVNTARAHHDTRAHAHASKPAAARRGGVQKRPLQKRSLSLLRSVTRGDAPLEPSILINDARRLLRDEDV